MFGYMMYRLAQLILKRGLELILCQQHGPFFPFFKIFKLVQKCFFHCSQHQIPWSLERCCLSVRRLSPHSISQIPSTWAFEKQAFTGSTPFDFCFHALNILLNGCQRFGRQMTPIFIIEIIALAVAQMATGRMHHPTNRV